MRRDEDDQLVGQFGNTPHELYAVGIGKYQVEQDHVGSLHLNEAGKFPMIAGHQRCVARFRKRVAKETQRLRVVVHHQDACLVFPFLVRNRLAPVWRTVASTSSATEMVKVNRAPWQWGWG